MSHLHLNRNLLCSVHNNRCRDMDKCLHDVYCCHLQPNLLVLAVLIEINGRLNRHMLSIKAGFVSSQVGFFCIGCHDTPSGGIKRLLSSATKLITPPWCPACYKWLSLEQTCHQLQRDLSCSFAFGCRDIDKRWHERA